MPVFVASVADPMSNGSVGRRETTPETPTTIDSIVTWR